MKLMGTCIGYVLVGVLVTTALMLLGVGVVRLWEAVL